MVVVECWATLLNAETGGIPLVSVSYLQASLIDRDGPSAVWVPPRLRLRADGEAIVVAEDRAGGTVAFRRMPAGGEPVDPVPLAAGPVIDALPAGEGAWLLERGRDAAGSLNVLRHVGSAGTTVSRRSGRRTAGGLTDGRLDGAVERLLGDDAGAAFVVAERPATAIARVGADGELEPWLQLAPPGAHPVMDGTGRLGWMALDAQHGELLWHVRDPGGGSLQRTLPDGAAGPESVPVGFDGRGAVYLADPSGLTCVAADAGGIAWRLRMEGAALGAAGVVVTATTRDGALDLTEWREGERSRDFRLPTPAFASGRSPAWRLIGCPAPCSYLLWGAEEAGASGVLAVVAEDGRVVELADPAPADARLRGWWPAPAREWQVDGAGRAYISLGGPDGAAILRIAGGPHTVGGAARSRRGAARA